MKLSVSFDKIKRSATKSGVCIKCNKKCKRNITITKTVNPFNKNKHGFTKTREEVLESILEEIKEWKKNPIFHSKCE